MRYATCGVLLLLACCILPAWAEEPRSQVARPRIDAEPSPAAQGEAKASGWTSYESLHKEAVDQFVKSQGFGLSRIVRVNETPTDWVKKIVGQEVQVADQAYTISNIQLIGIVKHDPPVVHIAPAHPLFARVYNAESESPSETPAAPAQQVQAVSQKLAPVPKAGPRELNKSEAAVLELFREGGEISTVTQENKQLVYGSIRASESCLRCHEGSKKGDLLGALIYHLQPPAVR